MSLDFNERVNSIVRSVTRFLRQYRQPEHLTDETATAVVKTIAEAINTRLPPSLGHDGLDEVMEKIAREVAVTYRGRDWPGAAHFVAAIPKQDTTPDPLALTKSPRSVMAERIMRGEPIGDGWIWGRQAKELLLSGEIAEGDLQPYRETHFHRMKNLYGLAKADRMIADLKNRHDGA